MRFALPLVLLVLAGVLLVFFSREPDVLPDITGTDNTALSDQQKGRQGAAPDERVNTKLRAITGAGANRVCVAEPLLLDVAAEAGDTIAGVGQFDVQKALESFTEQQDIAVNSLRTITLAVVIDEQSRQLRSLSFNLGGVEATFNRGHSSDAVLRFPGHLLRNHSIVTVVVRDDDGDLLDLSNYTQWALCGEPFDDPSYTKKQVVKNDVSDLTPGPGVNVMGGEYACAQGWGLQHHLAVGVSHEELANMLAAWGVKTVRVPLNEHCWLADSYPFPYLNTNTTGRIYRESIQQLVELLTSQYQMHVVLDLHWTGTMVEKALELKPLPNHEFSEAFWRDVAEQFAHNDNVIFNLFNEPHIPAPESNQAAVGTAQREENLSIDAASLADADPERRAADENWWIVWRDGNDQYAGMQKLVDAIRNTGATNHISVGGLDFSADQRGWLTYAPYDPLGRLWVDNHAYPAEGKCTDELCWGQTLLPLVANGYGVMFGETGNSIGQSPQGCQSDFVKRVYRFAREHSIPVLAWTFIAGGVEDSQLNKPLQRNCQIPTLITRWPGELIDGDLSPNEINEKKSYDPTPDNLLDDATWPGCVFYAYANDLSLDDDHLPNIDPAEAGGGNYGKCVLP
jgi:hypothetical protein